MPVPAKHRPKSKTRKNRSHSALIPTTATSCSNCGQPVRPHYACPTCGYYKGRSVMKIKSRKGRAKPTEAAAK
ncbi:MAG: 50S ribosomal protein L32 [Patescibacteria group bacterium]